MVIVPSDGSATSGALTVNSTCSGTSTSGSDFQTLPCSLTIPDGTYHISDTIQFTGNERFNTLQG